MSRFLASLTFCLFLLISGAFLLSRPSSASEDVVSQLLMMPAPPPPNPLVPDRGSRGLLHSSRRVPPDDAPIADLLEYWSKQSQAYQELRYNPKPSPRVLDRLRAEIDKDPKTVASYLNCFRDSPDGSDFIKRIYDNWPADVKGEADGRPQLKQWLTRNSSYFTGELEKPALRAGERGEYVTNQEQVLTLAKYDWDAVRPSVDRLYGDASKPVSRVLATWALYVHALEENSLGDIDRYRDELKAFVEDKKATPGMRDLAFDALVKEKEWGGRDEWYYSLLEDETLAELRVNGSTYTGLTTIILYSHPDKYADKMIELVKSSNLVIRNAAVRNLGVILDHERLDVIKALLPWLEDPKWAKDTGGGTRQKLLRILQSVKMPESTPGLIAVLDETETYILPEPDTNGITSSNSISNAANTIANAVAFAVNRPAYVANGANVMKSSGRSVTHFPLRGDAVRALAQQSDIRAVPALRRILRETNGYERNSVVRALLHCNGFTVIEQANALETYARTAKERQEEMAYTSNSANAMSNAVWGGPGPNYHGIVSNRAPTGENLEYLLGSELLGIREPAEQLVREVAARITTLEKKEPATAQTLLGIMLLWKGAAVNVLLLKDLKDGKSSADAIVKLLSVRKDLREKQSGDVFDIRTSNSLAAATAACLLETDADYAGILNGDNTEAKAAMLACARLIRAKLPVRSVAKYLSHTDKRLASAAESYLESEDSREARSIVLSLHPNEAKIMGATTAFWPTGAKDGPTLWMMELFETVAGRSGNGIGERSFALSSLGISAGSQSGEKVLREEMKSDASLVGIYALEDNFVRIHKDKVLYSWGEDESRYHERALPKEEFEELTRYLADHKVDELVPFLDCDNYCEQKELVMLGKSGGRRVFVSSSREPEFFAGLGSLFEKMRQGPAKLRYRLEKEIPGLEILLADDDLAAQTVWTNGGEVRVLVADAIKRQTIDREIQDAVEEMVDEAEQNGAEEEMYESGQAKSWELEQKRKFDSLEWFRFNAGRLGAKALQPAEAEFIPVRDSFAPAAEVGQWKAKAAGIEIRADDEGLHKIAAGKMTKIKTGSFDSPVVTANGKWVFVTKYSDDGDVLVRINLLTNKEFPVVSEKFPVRRAVAYVPSINKVLASPLADDESEYYVDEPALFGGYFWIDPDSGAVQPASGEMRPLAQQTFRALQPGPGAYEFWAAIHSMKNKETRLGLYSTKTFTFRPLLTVPKIRFESMDMWVDAAAAKVYFVYNGHLLALPLAQPKTSSTPVK